MSYILDALKRADNERERERGAVPGLYSQPVLPPTTPQDDGDGRGWLWVLGGVVAVVLGGLAWYQFGPAIQITSRATALPAPPPLAAPLPPPAITAITAVPASADVPPATPLATPPAPTPAATVPANLTAPVPPVAAPEPGPRQSLAAQANAARRAAAAEAAAARSAARAEQRAQARTPRAAETPVPATVLPTPAEPVYSFNELPANIRSEIPTVVIGGSSYSPNPKFRLLMVNGQMYQEREKPLPNLVLEQINPKSAVMNYKGYRYSINY